MATSPASALEPEKQKKASGGSTVAPLAAAPVLPGSGPEMMFVEGTDRRQFRLTKGPFAIGRRVDKDLVLTDTRCSRDHAMIVCETDGYYLVDGGSKLGTFVNGVKIERQKLKAKDKIEFGTRGGAYLVFDADSADVGDAGLLLSRMSGWMPKEGVNVNRSSVLEKVLVTLVTLVDTACA